MDRRRKRLLVICLIIVAVVLVVEAVVIAGVNGWLPGSRQAKQKSGDRTEGVIKGGESKGSSEGAAAENPAGGVSSDVSGAASGDSSGDVSGAVSGNSSGDLSGAASGDSSGDVSGAVSGNSPEDSSGNASGNGEPSSDVIKLKFRMGSLQEGDVPDEVFEQITRINSGELLAEVVDLEGLEGYFALTGTSTVVAEAKEEGGSTETKEDGGSAAKQGTLTLHVPNLLAGLEDISVLFYGNEAGEWKLIPANKTDMEAKTVSVTLTGSGTLAVVYRRQTEETD